MNHNDLFNALPKVKKKSVLPPNPEKKDRDKAVGPGRFPSWLHRSLPKGSNLFKTNQILGEERLHTVCEEAKCPNLLECYSKKTATFLVLGKECTRACGFCDIDHNKQPEPVDINEPKKLAAAAQQLGLKHVVITMVARDDLTDGGASHLAQIIEEIRQQISGSTTEVLTSDFEGKTDSITKVLEAKPDIFNHNIETVAALSKRVRHTATYERTLEVLRFAKENRRTGLVKSGLMVGLGESTEQVQATLHDLYEAGCDIVTIGQYLQPNPRKLRVKAFITPQQFKQYEDFGHQIGIKYMYCGPFVRSSYNAGVVQRKFEMKESVR